MKDTVNDLRAAAKHLEMAAESLRTEADWLEQNWPLPTWSAQTAENYLRAARAQATVDAEGAAREAIKRVETNRAATSSIGGALAAREMKR